MLPMTFAVVRLFLAGGWNRPHRILFGCTIACFALTSLTADVIGPASDYVVALGCMGWGALALLAGLLVALPTKRPAG